MRRRCGRATSSPMSVVKKDNVRELRHNEALFFEPKLDPQCQHGAVARRAAQTGGAVEAEGPRSAGRRHRRYAARCSGALRSTLAARRQVPRRFWTTMYKLGVVGPPKAASIRSARSLYSHKTAGSHRSSRRPSHWSWPRRSVHEVATRRLMSARRCCDEHFPPRRHSPMS